MAKLVVLGEGQNGRTLDLKDERTTVGRLDDNAFQIPEQSISSHHCEILLKGTEVVVKDLGSTNGTFINGEQITEKALKPGQVLRLGKVELRFEDGQTPSGSGSSASQPASQTTISGRSLPHGGVKLGDTSGAAPVFAKNSPFAKKSNKTAIIFITIGVILFAAIVVALILAFSQFKSP